MAVSPDTPPRIHGRNDGELAYWARVLDESPSEIQRAMRHAGPEVGAIRQFLFARQLGLDLEPAPADVAARTSAGSSA